MAEERRKGPPERRHTGKAAQVGEQRVTSVSGTPDVQVNEQDRANNPNEAAAFDAEQLDAANRARQQQDRGEVF